MTDDERRDYINDWVAHGADRAWLEALSPEDFQSVVDRGWELHRGGVMRILEQGDIDELRRNMGTPLS